MRLDQNNLEFARKHISAYYASDFFPVDEEYTALWANWDEVSSHLRSIPVGEMEAEELFRLPAPKATGGYRVVHRPQPIDAIVLTAIAHRIAPYIEARRVPRDEAVACSYRIDLTESGDFFGTDGNGYQLFASRSRELAEAYEWALSFDISNFYNQIYIHRLQGAIEHSNRALRADSEQIENYLLNINQRQSIGVPVGPAASIIFAEAILIDVDEFIRNEFPGAAHTRYVDDFRVFCRSEAQMRDILEAVTIYLHDAHRLGLSHGKTMMCSASEFVDSVLDSPEMIEHDRLNEEATQALAEIASFYEFLERVGDEASWDTASSEQRRTIVRDMFRFMIEQPVLDIGLARHIIRRARRLRARFILNDILTRMAFLGPVVRDVGLYLGHVFTDAAIERHRADLSHLATIADEQLGQLPAFWLRWLFAQRRSFRSTAIDAFMHSSRASVRQQAMYARVNEELSWVRNRKSQWRDHGRWDRRGILFAGQLLPSHERGVWLDRVISVGDLHDRSVAKYVRSQ